MAKLNPEKIYIAAEVGAITLIAGGLIYLVYKISSGLFSTTPASQADANGEYSGGLLEKAVNNSASIGKSSLSYTDAVTQAILHPWDTTKTILGIGDKN